MSRINGINAEIRVIKNHSYHYHNHLTIVMMIAGQINVRVWARDNIMKEGDVLVINSGEIHKLSAVTKDNLVVVISIHEIICKEASRDYVDSIIFCNSVQYRHKNPKLYAKLYDHLKEMIYVYDDTHAHLLRVKTHVVIQFLCDHFNYLSSGENHEPFSDYIVARNKMLYRKVFSENGEYRSLSLKEISEELGLSYTYFRTDIIDRFGFGFRWLKYTRMTEKAARLVLETDLTLMNIANQCGFSDQKYFIKYFKKFFECTPSQFRKLYKDKDHEHDFVRIPLNHVMSFCKNFKK